MTNFQSMSSCKFFCGELKVHLKELHISLKCIYKSSIKCLYEFHLGTYKCYSVRFWVSFPNNDDHYWLGLDWYTSVSVLSFPRHTSWYTAMNFANLTIHRLLEKCNLFNSLFNLTCIYDRFDLTKFIWFILSWTSLKKGTLVSAAFN